jgi:hypothetical protein
MDELEAYHPWWPDSGITWRNDVVFLNFTNLGTGLMESVFQVAILTYANYLTHGI